MGWFGDQAAAFGGDDFPAAVLALVKLLLVGVAAWALLVGALSSSPVLRRVAVALTPRVLRGLVFAGVAGAMAVPAAQADDRGVDGLTFPDRPLVDAAPHAAKEHTQPRQVIVRPGDTLWAMARSRLGRGAGNGAVAREVDRWYRLNHDVIGDDPDLIHPGQRLTAPTKERP